MKSKSNPFPSSAISGAAVVFASFSMLNPSALAADQVWIGSADDHDVTTPGNWVSWVSEGDTCSNWAPFVFGSDTVNGTVNLDRWVAISSITLNSGLTHDITIDNGPIIMGGSLVDMSSAGANLTLNAQVQQGWGDMTFNVGAGRTLTANGGVAESGWFELHTGLTKNGAGTVVLGGASTYTLDTTINAGTLELGGSGTLGGGSYAGAIINYGAFVHSSSANQTLAVISGPGSITQSGTGTLTLTSYGVGNSGTITVNSGTLQAPDGSWQQESHHIVVNGGTFSTSDGNSRALSWTLNGGTVSSRGDASPDFWGNIMLDNGQAVTVGGAAVSTISSHVMLGAGSEFAVDTGSTLNMTGALSNSVWATGGNGSFIKTGAGTLTLSGANNYTGSTTISGGTLIIDGSTHASSAISVGASGTLGGTGTINGTLGVTGMLSPGTGSGNITQLDAGSTTWNGGSVWNFDLAAASGSADQLAITGNFTKGSGSVFKFDFMGSAPNALGNAYTLVSWTGATNFSLSDFSFQNLGGLYNASNHNFAFSGNSLVFTTMPEVSSVPEASTSLGLLALGAGGLHTRRRAKQKA